MVCVSHLLSDGLACQQQIILKVMKLGWLVQKGIGLLHQTQNANTHRIS